jgi:hypothetical protein
MKFKDHFDLVIELSKLKVPTRNYDYFILTEHPWRVWFDLVAGTVRISETAYVAGEKPVHIWVPPMASISFTGEIEIADLGAAESGWPPKGGLRPTPELQAKMLASGTPWVEPEH